MLRRRSSSGKCSTKRRTSSVGFDEFGFVLSKRRDKKLQHRSHDYSYPQPNAVRVKELCELLSYWNGSSFICKSQIERFIRIGIPPSLRGRVWRCLLDIDKLRVTSVFDYQASLKEIWQPLVELGVSEYSIISAIAMLSGAETGTDATHGQCAPAHSLSSSDVALFRQIALDLQRSFPTHRSLMGDSPEAIEGQAKLFRVLTAYAKYNPQIGYSQGMSYIAAVLLMNLSEEEAFWALVALLEKPKYLSQLFDHTTQKIQHQAMVFHQFLKHRQPNLSQHIEKLGVSPVFYVIPWFMSLFTCLPCWDSVLAVWDLIMLHGLLAVFRTGLTIMQLLESRLLSMMDEAAVLPLLLRVPVDVSKHCTLIPALWNTEVQEWEITCMNNLVLEELHGPGDTGKAEVSPVASEGEEEVKVKEGDDSTSTPEEDIKETTCKKGAAGSGAKNVFARMLQAVQRYLLDAGRLGPGVKPSPAKSSPAPPRTTKTRATASLTQAQIRARRRSQRRLSHNAAVGAVAKAVPVSTQGPDGGAPQHSSPLATFRRLKCGPVGRVARRRSSNQSGRGKSLLFQTNKTPHPKNSPSASPVTPKPLQTTTASTTATLDRNGARRRMALVERNGPPSSVVLTQGRESPLI